MARTDVNFIVPSAWGKLYYLPIKNFDITYLVHFSTIKYQDESRLPSQLEQKRLSCPQVWSVDIKTTINGILQHLFSYIVPKGVFPQADDKGNVVSLWKYKCVLAANSSGRSHSARYPWNHILFCSNPLATKRRLNPTRPKELPSVRVVVAHPQIDFSAKPWLWNLKRWIEDLRPLVIEESCGVPFGWSLFAFSGIVPNPVERKAITM